MKISRNSPCPCGSGSKYKKCCLGNIPDEGPEIDVGGAKKSFDLNFYLVGFMDLLGQRDRLREFGQFPTNDAEKERLLKRAKDTFGPVAAFRKAFIKYIDSYSKMDASILEKIKPEHRAAFDKIRRRKIKYQYFSDCLIFYVSLKPEDDLKVPILSVFGGLLGAGSMFTNFMAVGQPFRGGIDVALAGECFENEIYGPALQLAYDLESKIAKHPRIVVGGEMLRFLNEASSLAGYGPEDIITRSTAEKCKELLTVDVDNNSIVDYMGKGFRDEIGKHSDQILAAKAYTFVGEQIAKFKECSNEDLSQRYQLVQDYMTPRIELWKP